MINLTYPVAVIAFLAIQIHADNIIIIINILINLFHVIVIVSNLLLSSSAFR